MRERERVSVCTCSVRTFNLALRCRRRYSHFVGVGVVGQVGGLSGLWFLAALGLVSNTEVLETETGSSAAMTSQNIPSHFVRRSEQRPLKKQLKKLLF